VNVRPTVDLNGTIKKIERHSRSPKRLRVVGRGRNRGIQKKGGEKSFQSVGWEVVWKNAFNPKKKRKKFLGRLPRGMGFNPLCKCSFPPFWGHHVIFLVWVGGKTSRGGPGRGPGKLALDGLGVEG